MEPNIQKIIDGLLDEVVAKGGEFDFVSEYAAYVPVSVTAEILGVEPILTGLDIILPYEKPFSSNAQGQLRLSKPSRKVETTADKQGGNDV